MMTRDEAIKVVMRVTARTSSSVAIIDALVEAGARDLEPDHPEILTC
jgi:hypothetical protein